MTKLIKTVGAGALAIVLACAPTLTFAHVGDKGAKGKASASVQVFMNTDGDTVVRGARVTDIDDDTITAETAWFGRTSVWTVRTDNGTDYIRKDGTSIDRSDIDEGDYISFSGDRVSGTFTIDAEVVKDWSIAGTFSTFAGTASDIDSHSFTLATAAHGDIEVRVDSSTGFSGLGSLADLDSDTKVMVYGSYDADTKVLTASKVSLSEKKNWNEKKHVPNGKAWGFWKKFSGFFNWR